METSAVKGGVQEFLVAQLRGLLQSGGALGPSITTTDCRITWQTVLVQLRIRDIATINSRYSFECAFQSYHIGHVLVNSAGTWVDPAILTRSRGYFWGV